MDVLIQIQVPGAQAMLGPFLAIAQQQYSFAISRKRSINASRQIAFGNGVESLWIGLKQRQLAIDPDSQNVVAHPEQMSDF